MIRFGHRSYTRYSPYGHTRPYGYYFKPCTSVPHTSLDDLQEAHRKYEDAILTIPEGMRRPPHSENWRFFLRGSKEDTELYKKAMQTVTIGKYKGFTYGDITMQDFGYIQWAAALDTPCKALLLMLQTSLDLLCLLYTSPSPRDS